MRKHFRIIAGIILHPVKMFVMSLYREDDEYQIRTGVLNNWMQKNHERVHRFEGEDFPDTCSFVHSELWTNLSRGAF